MSIADFSNVLGNAYLAQGRVDSGAYYLIKSAEILEKYNEDMKLGYLYNNISHIYIDDQEYNMAHSYLVKSKKHLDQVGGEKLAYYGVVIGNFSRVYLGMDSIQRASEAAIKTIEIGVSNENIPIQIYGIMTRGDIAAKLDKKAEAIEHYTKAYELSAQIKDDYRMAQNALLLAKNLKDSNPDKALPYALEADEFYKDDLPRYRIEIVKTLADIYENKGDSKKSLDYYKLYASLQDSILSYEYDKSKLELLEKYETTKKDLTIKTQENELGVKKLKILRLTSVLVIALLLIVGIIIYYLSQQKIKESEIKKIKLEQEQKMMMAMIEGEQKERTRLAKEIHDGIANEVAALKMQTELKNIELNSPILHEIENKLNNIHQNTRNAAHALFPKALIKGNLPQSIGDLCEEYRPIMLVNLDVKSYKPGKTKAMELFLYRLIQEALGNAVRHSGANEIQITIQEELGCIEIEITDNGHGMNAENIEKGLGYLQSRIQELGGDLNVNSDKNTGTRLKISFKYAS